ncbi:MAG: substrate-binding domain-containing protein [Gammaproteobacteria bacterium]|nr:substrate-binding domain-containing protein [Gammaproteobacteria bacterium]
MRRHTHIKKIKRLFMSLCLTGLSHLALASEAQFVIGFPEDNMSNDWRAAQMKEIQQALKKHQNVRFLMADAAGSVARNILDIENMVSQGVQLLFLGPKTPQALTPVVAGLRKKGIKIVLLTRKLNSEDYDVYIGPDDFKIAYEAATFLANRLHGKGTILMLSGIATTTTAIDRKKGFLAGLRNFAGIKVITKVANYSRSEAVMVVENQLNQNHTFDAIYAHNDAMASGARYALKQAGINPATKNIVGIDFLPEAREAILKGEQLASFTYPTCGKVGVEAALNLLKGNKVKRYITVPSVLVTKKNVNAISTVY